MMGLFNTNENTTFINIINSKFTVKVDENTEGAVQRENKNGNIVHELLFSNLSGKILDIAYKKKDFGDFVEIRIYDDGHFVLQLPWGNSLCNNLIKMLPNIDYGCFVEFCVFKERKSGRTALLIKQNGEWVKYAFTKDRPNGMPKPTQRKTGKWDFSKVEDFLFSVLEGEIERINKHEEEHGIADSTKEEIGELPDEDEASQGLPLDAPVGELEKNVDDIPF